MGDATDAGLFGLIVGGIFLLLGGANAWLHLREIRGWVRTRGRRVDWNADWDESYQRLGWRPVYAYEVDGRRLTTQGHAQYGSKEKPAVGEEAVTVRYDPAQPARAKAGFEAWFFVFGGAVGAAGIALTLYGVAKLV